MQVDDLTSSPKVVLIVDGKTPKNLARGRLADYVLVFGEIDDDLRNAIVPTMADGGQLIEVKV